MKFTRRAATISGLGLLASTAIATVARAEIGEGIRDLVEGLDDFALASDAYVFGYPLVTMEMTRRVVTNAAKVEGSHGPMGQLIKLRQYPDAAYRDVTAPNADTLYTMAFIDVGKEPWVLSIPDMKDRYFLFPMLDGWMDHGVSGARKSGRPAQARRLTRSPGRVGQARCLRALGNTNRRPASFGYSDAFIAPERQKITLPCMRCRTNANCIR
jgi:hypothetical protein